MLNKGAWNGRSGVSESTFARTVSWFFRYTKLLLFVDDHHSQVFEFYIGCPLRAWVPVISTFSFGQFFQCFFFSLEDGSGSHNPRCTGSRLSPFAEGFIVLNAKIVVEHQHRGLLAIAPGFGMQHEQRSLWFKTLHRRISPAGPWEQGLPCPFHIGGRFALIRSVFVNKRGF